MHIKLSPFGSLKINDNLLLYLYNRGIQIHFMEGQILFMPGDQEPNHFEVEVVKIISMTWTAYRQSLEYKQLSSLLDLTAIIHLAKWA